MSQDKEDIIPGMAPVAPASMEELLQLLGGQGRQRSPGADKFADMMQENISTWKQEILNRLEGAGDAFEPSSVERTKAAYRWMFDKYLECVDTFVSFAREFHEHEKERDNLDILQPSERRADFVKRGLALVTPNLLHALAGRFVLGKQLHIDGEGGARNVEALYSSYYDLDNDPNRVLIG